MSPFYFSKAGDDLTKIYMGKDLEFKNNVGENKSGIGENDKKIDMSGDEDIDTQQRVINAMTNGNNADNSGDSDDDSDEEEDEEESETEDDDSDEDDSEEDDEDESDDSDEEDEDESEDDDSKDDNDSEDEADDKKTGQFDGYDTFEEYKAAQKKDDSNDKEELDSKKSDGEVNPDAQFKTVISFFKKHSDVIPETTIENYTKYFESSNNAFIHLDNNLVKITREMANLNPNLPLEEKLEKAFTLVFKDKLAKMESKKATAITEAKAQKVNKSASNGTSANSNGNKKSYSSEQLKIMERFGVGKKFIKK